MANLQPPTKKLKADTANPDPSQECPSPSAAASADIVSDHIIENVDELLENLKITLIETHKSPSGLLSAVCLMKKLPICYHCCLRYLCIWNWTIYTLTEDRLHVFFTDFFRDLLVEDPNHSALYSTLTTTNLRETCTTCLGMLQNAYTVGFLDPIMLKLRLEEYLVLDFNLCLTLPVGTLVRNHALGLHLTSQFKVDNILPNYEPLNIVSLKDPLKLMLAWELKEKTKLGYNPDSKFRITVTFEHAETTEEHIFLTQVDNTSVKIVKVRQKRKLVTVGDGRQRIASTLKDIKPEVFAQHGKIPYPPVAIPAEITKIDMMHESVYVAGRYLKFSREYSQTPWLIGTRRLLDKSVSECITEPLSAYFRCDECKFVSAGREDADVLMLGTGRPFYIEFINPHSPQRDDRPLPVIQEEINTSPDASAVRVRHLLKIEENETKTIKEGEELKRKTYSALVWLSQEVTPNMIKEFNQRHEGLELVIQQKSPIRVMQRRALLLRPKHIDSLVAKLAYDANDPNLDPAKRHFVIMHIRAEAGTYIKEFVHGDLGRTKPSLGERWADGVHAEILALDVLEVDLEWPPQKKVTGKMLSRGVD